MRMVSAAERAAPRDGLTSPDGFVRRDGLRRRRPRPVPRAAILRGSWPIPCPPSTSPFDSASRRNLRPGPPPSASSRRMRRPANLGRGSGTKPPIAHWRRSFQCGADSTVGSSAIPRRPVMRSRDSRSTFRATTSAISGDATCKTPSISPAATRFSSVTPMRGGRSSPSVLSVLGSMRRLRREAVRDGASRRRRGCPPTASGGAPNRRRRSACVRTSGRRVRVAKARNARARLPDRSPRIARKG